MKQEALQEREQQKRADMTALAATQRKRPNPASSNVSVVSVRHLASLRAHFVQSSGTKGGSGDKSANATSGGGSNPGGVITSSSRPQRVTRVKMRDLLFCLDSERLDRGSRDEVYKRYLK